MAVANFGGEMKFSGAGLLRQHNAFPEAGNVTPIDADMKTTPYPLPQRMKSVVHFVKRILFPGES